MKLVSVHVYVQYTCVYVRVEIVYGDCVLIYVTYKSMCASVSSPCLHEETACEYIHVYVYIYIV